ncbi:uncharacterized protein LOC118479034 [Aplysia californica]|uniref:Uncharacterized protein LOC118479034 n=1 Tax=Aplysia californica TaxID=6500 RepID=A0ABM1W4A6_APLCA|nr:uncharacterized protein LOC118479034 [Aplysia californica]
MMQTAEDDVNNNSLKFDCDTFSVTSPTMPSPGNNEGDRLDCEDINSARHVSSNTQIASAAKHPTQHCMDVPDGEAQQLQKSVKLGRALTSWGCGEFGQHGHDVTGNLDFRAGDITHHSYLGRIKLAACGSSHTIVVTGMLTTVLCLNLILKRVLYSVTAQYAHSEYPSSLTLA